MIPILTALALSRFAPFDLEELHKADAPTEPLALHPPPEPNREEFPFVGQLMFQGLTIFVETAAGQIRKGIDADGVPWHVVMPWHYGEIDDTLGEDGDPVDVLIGPDADAPIAYVVHTRIPGTWIYDEDKVMLGFRSQEDAEDAFRECYNKPGFMLGITRWPVAELRAHLGRVDKAKMLNRPDRIRQALAKGQQIGLFHPAMYAHAPTETALGGEHPVAVRAHVRRTDGGIAPVGPHLRVVQGRRVGEAPPEAPAAPAVAPPPPKLVETAPPGPTVEAEPAEVLPQGPRVREVPRGRWSDFVERFEKLVTRAKKLGVAPPRYDVGPDRVRKVVERDLDGSEYTRHVNVREVTIHGPTIKLAGDWKLGGVVEPRAAGNKITGAAADLPDHYRHTEMKCDHCGLDRQRKRTFIVFQRPKVGDPGQYRMVGGECARDYLGHDPDAVANFVDLARDMEGACLFDEEGGTAQKPAAIPLETVLSTTLAVTDANGGYVSRAKASQQLVTPTVETVTQTLISKNPRPEKYLPTNVHEMEAKEIAGWLKELPEAAPGSYMENLRVATSTSWVDVRDLSFAVSSVAAYRRSKTDAARTATFDRAKNAANEAGHFGKEGDRIKAGGDHEPMLVRCVGTADYDTNFGHTTLIKLVDPDGHLFVWKSSSRSIFELPGHTVPLKESPGYPAAPGATQDVRGFHRAIQAGGEYILWRGSVKKHTEYRGTKETELTRCELLPAPSEEELTTYYSTHPWLEGDEGETLLEEARGRLSEMMSKVRTVPMEKGDRRIAHRPGLALSPTLRGQRWKRIMRDEKHPDPAHPGSPEEGGVRAGRRVGHGGQAPPSKEGAEKPMSIHDEPMPDLSEDFNTLPRAERAKRTADWGGVKREMNTRFSPQQYEGAEHSDLAAQANAHIDRIAQQGWVGRSNVQGFKDIVTTLAKRLQAAGASPADAAHILDVSVRKLAHQEVEAVRRTIGDHGIRHLSRNVQTIEKVLDALEEGGATMTPRDRLAGVLTMVQHDLGYTIPAIARGGFKVKDDYHPSASRELWLGELRDDPAYERVLGAELAEKMGEHIRLHSAPFIDWENDPLGTGVRVADNTHLFADKMPEVLFGDPRAMEVLVKLHLAKQMGQDWKPVRDALVTHINGRQDIDPPQKTALVQAANELSDKTPGFLVSRLAGRDAEFKWDAEQKTMTVNIVQSPLRRMFGEVFGDDEMDKQFSKMLTDFGTDAKAVLASGPPPSATLGKNAGKLTLAWTPPVSRASKMETSYLETARRVLAEASRAREEGPEAVQAFFSRLAKAVEGIDLLAKGTGFNVRRVPQLGARPKSGMQQRGLVQAPRRTDGTIDVEKIGPGQRCWVVVQNPKSHLRGETILIERRADGRFSLVQTGSYDRDLEAMVAA